MMEGEKGMSREEEAEKVEGKVGDRGGGRKKEEERRGGEIYRSRHNSVNKQGNHPSERITSSMKAST